MKGIKLLPHEDYLKEIKEPGSILVCSTGPCSTFLDRITDKCHDCGCIIHYRPYNKDVAIKVCIDCVMKRIDPEPVADGIT